MKRSIGALIVFCGVFVFSIQSVYATIEFEASGLSAKGVEVAFTAKLTITGDELEIVLINISPVASLNPDDTLGSFYFDIMNSDDIRPNLVYDSATGNLYTGDKNIEDSLSQAGANLMALMPEDMGWVFRTMDEMENPYLGFGIGTVGNNNLTPNNFPGMDGVETAIYRDEVTTQNLHGCLLVKNTARFTFTGLDGFTEDDILPEFAFGLGTAPDSLLTPEPATLALLGLGGLLLRKRR